MKSIDELILTENLRPILGSYVANLHGNELHSNLFGHIRKRLVLV
jgi:hypothetical protein